MNIQTKLRLIQEGFSIDQINSDGYLGQSFPYLTEASFDELFLFTDYYTETSYIYETTMEIIQESNSDVSKQNAFKRFIQWIIEKVRQFRKFITSLFKRKKQELIKAESKEISSDNSVTVKDTLKQIVDNSEAYKTLENLFNKFKNECVKEFDKVNKGKLYGLPNTSLEYKTELWKRVVNNSKVTYDQNVTQNVINVTLDHTDSVTINSQKQVENIKGFAEDFYGLSEEIEEILEQYESIVKELDSDDHIGFTPQQMPHIKLQFEVILDVFSTFCRTIDRHVVHLLSATSVQNNHEKLP